MPHRGPPLSSPDRDSSRFLTQLDGSKFGGQVKRVAIETGFDGAEKCIVDEANKNYFKPMSSENTEDEPIAIAAQMYRLNTRAKTGKLELIDDPARDPIPFTILSGDMENYVDFLKDTETTFLAKREMSINVLGETKINRLFLVGIAPGN